MSVIIRLQNLPWNANAIDIRRFFQGLSIPDGGVHIVGGEKGDAFIAFSTDEDARQAMMKDGGRVNSSQIKLLLSSKTEMQNVISAAKEAGPTAIQQQPPSGVNKESGYFDRQVGPPTVQYGSRDVGKKVPDLASYPVDNYRDRPRDYPGMPLVSSGRLADERVAGRGPGELLTGVPVPAGPPLAPGPYQPLENRQLGAAMIRPTQHPSDSVGFQHSDSVLRSQFGEPGPGAYDAPGGARGLGQPSRVNDFCQPNEVVADDRRRFGDFGPGSRYDANKLNEERFVPNFPGDSRNFGPSPGNRDFHRTDIDMPSERREVGAPSMGRNLVRPEVGAPGMGRNLVKPEVHDEVARSDMNRYAGDRSFNDRGYNKMDDKHPFNRPDIKRDFNEIGEYPHIPPEYMRREEPMQREMETGRSGWPGDRGPRRDGINDFNGRHSTNLAPGVDRSMHGQGDGFESSRLPLRPDVPGPRFGREAGMIDRAPPQVPDLRNLEVKPKYDSQLPRPHGQLPRPHDEFHNEPEPPSRGWPDDHRDMGYRDNSAGMFGDTSRDGRPPGRKFDPAQNEEWASGNRGPGYRRQEKGEDPRDQLTIRCSNFPSSFNYKEVRRFFSGCEIPREGLKLLNDRNGMRAGVAYIMFLHPRSTMTAVSMNGGMALDCKVRIERCSFCEYDEVVDSSIIQPSRPSIIQPTRPRSRSPLIKKHASTVQTTLHYFVIKKLPPKIERSDVKKFVGKFRIAADGGPFMELSPANTHTGNALVALEKIRNPGEVITALHKSVLNGCSVEVVSIKKPEYDLRTKRSREMDNSKGKDKTEEVKQKGGPKLGANKEAVSSDSDKRTLCIHIRGIPFNSTVSSIADFFRGLDIAPNGIRIVINREGRAAGDAFVEFTNLADVRKALEKDKQFLGHRYVELRTVSKHAMINEHRSLQKQCGGPSVDEEEAIRIPPGEIDHDLTISMQNLHQNTQLEDILDFFRGFRPIVDSIKLQYKDGKPTGDGLVAFSTHQEAENAVRSKNRQFLLGRQITLCVWSNN